MPSDTPAYLLELHYVPLCRILEFLLLAEEVKVPGPSATSSFTSYHFHVSILRTCKVLHDLGTDVFRKNNFVRISSKIGALMLDFTPGDVWTAISMRGGEEFRHHVMELKIVSPKCHLPQQVTLSFMTCAADLVNLVRVLQEFAFVHKKATYALHVLFKPRVGGTPHPLKVQQCVLLPFEKLQTLDQTCKITGSVDADLAKSFKHKLTPRVFWTRAQARNFFEIIKFKKSLADKILEFGHFQTAQRLYWKTHMTLHCAFPYIRLITMTGDDNLRDMFEQYLHQIHLSDGFAALWAAFTAERQDFNNDLPEPQQYGPWSLLILPSLPPKHLEMCDRIIGTIAFALGDYSKAKARFESALARAPTSAEAALGVQIVEQHLLQHGSAVVTGPYAFKSLIELIPKTDRTQLIPGEPSVLTDGDEVAVARGPPALESLMQLIPKRAITEPIHEEVSVLADVDEDRYRLQKFGYSGDTLESILQRTGWSIGPYHTEICRPFSPDGPAKIDEQLASILSQRAKAIARGTKLASVVVGSSGRAEDSVVGAVAGGLTGAIVVAFRAMVGQRNVAPMAHWLVSLGEVFEQVGRLL